MKRLAIALAIGTTFMLGTVSPAIAQSNNAAADVTHRCVALGVGEGTTTVRGEVVARFSAPAKQANANALGPCKPPLFIP